MRLDIPSLAPTRSVIHPRLPVILTFYPFALGFSAYWLTAARSFALCSSVQLAHSCTHFFTLPSAQCLSVLDLTDVDSIPDMQFNITSS
jgi:hypothetical protein